MLLWVLKCNAALLACKHQHAQNNTGRKTLCTLAVLSLTVLKYSSQNHVFTTLILKAGSVLHYFATSHCWGKSPAIPGRKYFCTGTVVLLHKYLILQGTRKFPQDLEQVVPGFSSHMFFCLLVWLDSVHLQKAFQHFFWNDQNFLLAPSECEAAIQALGSLSTVFSQRTWSAVEQMPHFGIPMLCLYTLISPN